MDKNKKDKIMDAIENVNQQGSLNASLFATRIMIHPLERANFLFVV